MSTENKTFKMTLDVSDLINNYKKALQTMQNIGGPNKAITQFEQTLEKLEKEFLQIQRVGSEGLVKDPQVVSSYTKQIDKAFKSLNQLGIEMTKLGQNPETFNINAAKTVRKEIENLTKEATKFQNTFQQALRGVGLGQGISKEMAQQVRTEQQLIAGLERELSLRQSILNKATAEAQTYQRSQLNQIVARTGNVFMPSGTSALTLTTQGSKALTKHAQDEGLEGGLKQLLQSYNKEITEALNKGQTFKKTWDDLAKEIAKDSGLQLNQVLADIKTIKGKIRSAFEEIDRISNSRTGAREFRNVADAQASINQLQSVIDAVRSGSSNLIPTLNSVAQAEQRVVAAENELANATMADARATNELNQRTANLVPSTRAAEQAARKNADAMRETAIQVNKTETAFGRFIRMISSMFSLYTVFAKIRQEIRKTYEDIKTLDKSFASIAMVTDKQVSEMWATYSQYAEMASELGQKTNSVIEASALFYQQGLNTNEALSLTTDTMKLATLAGENYKTATEEMTSAVRGFNMEMTEGAHVTDVYSTLAAGAAASVNDIAQAMARTASIANSAGSSFENTSAFLTKVIETTQESAEN